MTGSNATALAEAVQHVHMCMCAALTETAAEIDGQPSCPCRSGPVPGNIPLICCPDKGCGEGGDVGQLAVWFVRMWRSSNFPQQDTQDIGCKQPAKSLVAEIAVSLVRCVPVIDDNGRLPSMAAQARAAEVAAIDAMTLEIAAECCVPLIAGRRKPIKVGILSHLAVGPTGINGPNGSDAKCAGSELHLAVDIGAICCSSDVS